MNPPVDPTTAAIERSRSKLTDALHLFALSGFAVAQPLFDLLGRTPALFHVHHAEPLDIIAVTLVAVLLPAALLIGLEAIAGLLGGRVRALVHVVLVSALAGLIALPILGRSLATLSGFTTLTLAALVGTGAGVAYCLSATLRGFLTTLAAAVPIFALLFLFWSPVSGLVLQQKLVIADAKSTASTPVVMVVFDEFSGTSLLDEHARIDKQRFPNFARLAGTSTWFQNATTVATMTEIAVGAIATGRYPAPGKPDWPTLRNRNIFTLLAPSHRLEVTEPYVWYCPRALCPAGTRRAPRGDRLLRLLSDVAISFLHLATPAELRDGLPELSQPMMLLGQTGPNDDKANFGNFELVQKRIKANSAPLTERSDAFDQFLRNIQPSAGPVLYYLHSLLPHEPSVYLPSGALCATVSFRDPIQFADKVGAAQAYQRHLQQIGFVDRLVGRLMDRLQEVGLWDRSLVIIVADHGTSYRVQDHRRGLTTSNECDILPVPLFVKAPGQSQGRVSDRNVEVIDVLPTIAQVVGIDPPWPVDGSSVLDETHPARPHKIITGPNWDVENRLFGAKTRLERPAQLPLSCMDLVAKRRLFVSIENEEPMLAIGPYAALVGRPAAELDATSDASFRMTLTAAGLYLDVDPSKGFIPCTIFGTLEGEPPAIANGQLAVAVNGRIIGLANSWRRSDGVTNFSLPAPESAFRNGRNDVEVFYVTGPGTAPRLERVRDAVGGAYALREDGLAITAPDGRAIPVRAAAVRGGIESLDVGNAFLKIEGRAADADSSGPPERLIVFLDGAFHHAGPPSSGSAAPGDTSERPFSLLLPVAPKAAPTQTQVRVFALTSGGVASELLRKAP